MMQKALSAVVAVAVALSPVVTLAQAQVKDPEVVKGMKALDDGDYDLAIFTLDSATRRLAANPATPTCRRPTSPWASLTWAKGRRPQPRPSSARP